MYVLIPLHLLVQAPCLRSNPRGENLGGRRYEQLAAVDKLITLVIQMGRSTSMMRFFRASGNSAYTLSRYALRSVAEVLIPKQSWLSRRIVLSSKSVTTRSTSVPSSRWVEIVLPNATGTLPDARSARVTSRSAARLSVTEIVQGQVLPSPVLRPH